MQNGIYCNAIESLNSGRTKSLRDGLPRLWRSVSFTQKAVDSETMMMYV
jgi:hypothetical protein